MPDNWSIVANRYRLPYSQRVDIPILLQVFSHTATSYKYLYFQALLHILEETGFNNQVIRLDDILLEMLTLAWYPHTYFKLSFGINDRVAQELDRNCGGIIGQSGWTQPAESQDRKNRFYWKRAVAYGSL